MKFTVTLLLGMVLSAQTSEYERATQLLASGDAAGAAALFRDLVRTHPSSPDMQLNLSIAEFKAGHFGSSAESAAAALRLAPNLPPAYLFLGASQLELGDFPAAIASLEKAVALSPGDRNARLMLADALAGAEQPKQALVHYGAVLQSMPSNARALYGIGRTYDALGEDNRAREAWAKLEQLQPSPELHIHLAERHAAALRWPAAAAELREALRIRPDNRKAKTGLAWSLFKSRDYEGTVAALQPLLTGSPSADVLFLHGAALMNMQVPQEALPVLTAALAKAPNMREARAALGQALLQLGRPAEAVPHLTAGLPADLDGTTHFQLFRAYQLSGRQLEAQHVLADYRRIRAAANKISDQGTVR